MATEQSDPRNSVQSAPESEHPPVQDWDRLVAKFLPILAETASIRLGQECELEYVGTRAASEYRPSGPGLFVSLSVGGQYSGAVHLPLDFSLAHNLAQSSFGQTDPPEVDETQPLDEARAQAVEDLVAVLAQTAVDHLSNEYSAQLELAVSDRDQLPAPDQELPQPAFLKFPSWQIAADVLIDHTHIGQALLLIPAALFHSEDLDFDEDQDGYNLGPEEMAALVHSNSPDKDEHGGPTAQDQTADESDAGSRAEEPAQGESEPDNKETVSTVDIQALHTTLLQASYQVEEELSSLLGETFELYDYISRVISKKDFLRQFQNKVVITNLAVSGDNYGTVFLVLSLADAITLGGKLIMLPLEEISRKIKSGQLKEDEEDAYGEVINILTGAYSHAFGEYFPYKLRLKKDRMTSMAPTKVDISSDEPFPDGEYFLASYRMRLGSQNLEQLNILISPSLVSMSLQDVEALKKQPSTGAAGQAGGTGTIFIPGQEGGGTSAIAVISEDSQQGQVVATSLEDEGVDIVQLKIRDKIRDRLKSYDVIGAFLVLKNIDDSSLATLIKVRSVLKGRCPLIICGPKWTRTKVIQAVRYGASDILTTPPDPAQIVDKTRKHMMVGSVH